MIELITNLLGEILYPLFSIIFVIISLLQNLFQAFAGTGTIWYNGERIDAGNTGKENDTGIVYYLLNSALIRNMLISIAILALFLIVIFTAMAFIKNVYSSKPKKWQDIVANAFKGLINFIFVPVCCLLGVWAGNILLNAIAGATSASGATDLERQLFTVSAYNANLYRCDKATGPDTARAIYTSYLPDGTDVTKYVPDGKTNEEYALLVDQAYGQGVKDENGTVRKPSIYEWFTVGKGYKLFKINYLMLVAGGVFMMYILVNLAYAMVQRMFILLMLFIISPAMAAMYPIDEGNAMNSWKKSFVQYTIMAYSAVAGMNLFFSISPIIQNIEVVNTGMFFNDIIQIILLIIGLFCVKKFIDMLTGYIGGMNALSEGESMRKQTKGAIAKYGKKTVQGAFRAGGNFKRAVKASWDKTEKGKHNFGSVVKAGFAGLGKGLVGGTVFDAANALNKEGAKTLGFDGKDAKGWKDLLKKSAIGQAREDEKKRTHELELGAETKNIIKALENDLKLIAQANDAKTKKEKKEILKGLSGNKPGGNKYWGTDPDKMIAYAEKMGYSEEIEHRTGISLEGLKADKETKSSLKGDLESLQALQGKREIFAQEQGFDVDYMANQHLWSRDQIYNEFTSESERDAMLATNEAIKEAKALKAEEASLIESINKSADKASTSMSTQDNRNAVNKIVEAIAAQNNNITKGKQDNFNLEVLEGIMKTAVDKLDENNKKTNKELIQKVSDNFKEIKANSKKE